MLTLSNTLRRSQPSIPSTPSLSSTYQNSSHHTQPSISVVPLFFSNSHRRSSTHTHTHTHSSLCAHQPILLFHPITPKPPHRPRRPTHLFYVVLKHLCLAPSQLNFLRRSQPPPPHRPQPQFFYLFCLQLFSKKKPI